MFGEVTDSSRLVRPWIVRLRRARNDAEATTQITRLVAQLPEEVRWAVVTLGYSNSLYTEPEARALLSELSAPVKNAIQNEKRLLRNALMQCNGNRTQAAKLLGMSRRTLHRKLKQWPDLDVR